VALLKLKRHKQPEKSKTFDIHSIHTFHKRKTKRKCNWFYAWLGTWFKMMRVCIVFCFALVLNRSKSYPSRYPQVIWTCCLAGCSFCWVQFYMLMCCNAWG